MGSINHSTAFVSSFVMDMYTVLATKIKHFLTTPDIATGRLPVYAINADKVTELRRTGQVVGMLVMIRGVIKCGVVQPF